MSGLRSNMIGIGLRSLETSHGEKVDHEPR
jgi:hypothetical protein